MGVFLLELHTLNSHLYFSWFLWFLERSLIESYSYFPAERVSSLIIFFFEFFVFAIPQFKYNKLRHTDFGIHSSYFSHHRL